MPAVTSKKRIRLGIEDVEQFVTDVLPALTSKAKPKTTDEIKAEYERLEDDLRTQHEQQIAGLYREYNQRLEDLCEQRAAELAEVEGKGSDGETAEIHEG